MKQLMICRILGGVFLTIWLAVHMGKAWAYTFSKVEGQIAAGKKSLTIKIVIDSLLSTEFTSGDTEAQRLALGIKLTGSDEGKYILNSETESNTDKNDDFYWKLTKVTEESSGSKFKLTYQITVHNNGNATDDPSTIEKLMAANSNQVTIRPAFAKTGGDHVDSTQTYTFKQNFLSPAGDPVGLTVTGVHKGVRVTWTGNQEVLYTKVDPDNDPDTTQIPSSMLVMLFHPDENNLDLQSSIISGVDGEPEARICRFTVSTDTNDCFSCLDANGAASTEKISINATQEIGGIQFQTVDNTSATPEYTFSNLETDKEYRVAIQYIQGIKRSQCHVVVPIETVTLTELNGEPDAETSDPRCFIISATYGTHPESVVHTFRWFRDAFLMPWSFGQSFVRWYYQHSPALAAKIEQSDELKSTVGIILWPVSKLIEVVKFFYDQIWLTILLIGLLSGYLCFRLFRFKAKVY